MGSREMTGGLDRRDVRAGAGAAPLDHIPLFVREGAQLP